MGFQELKFLFAFLPVFLLLYYLVPQKLRNYVLIVGSVAFYAIGTLSHPWFLYLLLGFTLVSWLFSIIIRGNKPLLIVCLGALFGSLLYFKYAGAFGVSTVLPLGISFYCFQISAYLVDVYCGRIKPKNLISYVSGILMFPKLLSGPLMEPKDLFRQNRCLQVGLGNLDDGLRDFIIGLGLKVLLADRIGALWVQVGNCGIESVSAPLAWYGLLSYSLQLYFDFFGYSLMAIGIGKMLGFRLPDNFLHPYMAFSVADFYRRWHVTLGAWFKKYIYIPLGGSRNGNARLVLSTMAVWLFTGMWHGNSWNYVLWGLFLGLVILLERFSYGKFLERHQFLAHFYTIPVIMFSWLIFALPSLKDVGIYMSRLLSFSTFSAAADFARYGKGFTWLLVLGCIFATPLPRKLWDKLRDNTLGTVILLVIFWAAVYCVSISANDPFMYFGF